MEIEKLLPLLIGGVLVGYFLFAREKGDKGGGPIFYIVLGLLIFITTFFNL